MQSVRALKAELVLHMHQLWWVCSHSSEARWSWTGEQREKVLGSQSPARGKGLEHMKDGTLASIFHHVQKLMKGRYVKCESGNYFLKVAN